jgi:hypothetical protein
LACIETAVIGCTPLESPSDTAADLYGTGSQDAGETPDESGESQAWSCLNQPMTLNPQEPNRVKYVVAIVDFDSQPPPNMPTAVEGLTITVCGSPSCVPPYTAPDVVITNPVPGLPPFVYSIEFPYNFSNGYLRLTAPNYATMEYIFGGPMVGPPQGGYVIQGLTIPLLKIETRDTIYHDLGLPGSADPNRGVLAVRTLDCGNSRAAGVHLQATPAPPSAPAVAWTLSFSNRATPNKLDTDERGVAGFVNVLPGTLDVEGIAPVGHGAPYGATTLPVHAGVITLGEIRPGLDLWGQ